VATSADLERAVRPETALVGIDEAQFFGLELCDSAGRLALRGMDVVVGGLDVTFTGEPFEPIPSLMALAESVTKLTAVCSICGADAVFHQRIARSHRDAHDVVAEHIGGLDKYEARCRRHFEPR
jgi:thymidine kinase